MCWTFVNIYTQCSHKPVTFENCNKRPCNKKRKCQEVRQGYCPKCDPKPAQPPRSQTVQISALPTSTNEKGWEREEEENKFGPQIKNLEARAETWGSSSTKVDEDVDNRNSRGSAYSDGAPSFEGKEGLSRKLKGMLGRKAKRGKYGVAENRHSRESEKTLLSPTLPRSPGTVLPVTPRDEFGFYHAPTLAEVVGMGSMVPEPIMIKSFSERVEKKGRRRGIVAVDVEGPKTSAPELGESLRVDPERYVPVEEQRLSFDEDEGNDCVAFLEDAIRNDLAQIEKRQRSRKVHIIEDRGRNSPNLDLQDQQSRGLVSRVHESSPRKDRLQIEIPRSVPKDERPSAKATAESERRIQDTRSPILTPKLRSPTRQSDDYVPGKGGSRPIILREDYQGVQEEAKWAALAKKEKSQMNDYRAREDIRSPRPQTKSKSTGREIEQSKPNRPVRLEHSAHPIVVEDPRSPASPLPLERQKCWDDGYPEEHCDSSSDLIHTSGMNQSGSRQLDIETTTVAAIGPRVVQSRAGKVEQAGGAMTVKEETKESDFGKLGDSGKGGNVRAVGNEAMQRPLRHSQKVDQKRIETNPRDGMSRRVGKTHLPRWPKNDSEESKASEALRRADQRMARVRDCRRYIDYKKI